MTSKDLPTRLFVAEYNQRNEKIKHCKDTIKVLSDTFEITRDTDLIIHCFCIEQELNILQTPYN